MLPCVVRCNTLQLVGRIVSSLLDGSIAIIFVPVASFIKIPRFGKIGDCNGIIVLIQHASIKRLYLIDLVVSVQFGNVRRQNVVTIKPISNIIVTVQNMNQWRTAFYPAVVDDATEAIEAAVGVCKSLFGSACA